MLQHTFHCIKYNGIWQMLVGACGNIFLGKPFQKGLPGDLQGIDPGGDGNGGIVSLKQGFAARKAQALAHLAGKPPGVAVTDGQIVQFVVPGNLRQGIQTALEGPQHAVGIAGGAGVGVFFHQLHRLVYGGAVGDPGEEHQLIGTQTQGVQHLRGDLFQGACRKAAQQKIQIFPVLQHAVSNGGGQGGLLSPHTGAGLFQIQVGPGPLPAEGDQRPQGSFSRAQHVSLSGCGWRSSAGAAAVPGPGPGRPHRSWRRPAAPCRRRPAARAADSPKHPGYPAPGWRR